MKYTHFYLQTFGCQMNFHDSERIESLLIGEGFIKVSIMEESNITIMNTCAVREKAAQRVYGWIGMIKGTKAYRSNNMIIAIVGCLAQKEREILLAKGADIIVGTHNIRSLIIGIQNYEQNKKPQIYIEDRLVDMPSHIIPLINRITSYVVISIGCNNSCTFCIVPSLKGKQVDRPIEEIIEEIKRRVESGIKEIILLGQNVNSYGISLYKKRMFSKLLEECTNIDKNYRLRFTAPHPRDFTDDVLEIMSTNKIFMPTLHMPLQSGSNRILRLMKRSYNQERFMSIVDKAYEKVKDCIITTDIIVGFPSETDEDFNETLKIIERARFGNVYMFKYSKRDDTPAAYMDDQISKEVVDNRFKILKSISENSMSNVNKNSIGKYIETIIESKSNNKISGRTYDGRIINIKTDKNINVGDKVDIKCIDSRSYYLIGSF